MVILLPDILSRGLLFPLQLLRVSWPGWSVPPHPRRVGLETPLRRCKRQREQRADKNVQSIIYSNNRGGRNPILSNLTGIYLIDCNLLLLCFLFFLFLMLNKFRTRHKPHEHKAQPKPQTSSCLVTCVSGCHRGMEICV